MKEKIKTIFMLVILSALLVIMGFVIVLVYSIFMNKQVPATVGNFITDITIASENFAENIYKQTTEKVTLNLIDAEGANLEDLELETENSEQINYKQYYYNQLNDYSKIIYNGIKNNKENMKTGTYKIDFGESFSDLLSTESGEKLLGEYYQSALEAYAFDYPEVFYIDYEKLYLNMETRTKLFKTTYNVYVDAQEGTNYLLEEFNDENAVKVAMDKIEQLKDNVIRGKKNDTYENIRYIHDYLIDNLEYDQTLAKNNIYDIYGALINKTCVCEGYAEAFKYFMDELEIPCVLVIGTATNSENETETHEWNYVQVDGNWYSIDCTWDDPIIIGGGSLTYINKYKYFLKGSVEDSKTHSPNGKFTEKGQLFQYPELSLKSY